MSEKKPFDLTPIAKALQINGHERETVWSKPVNLSAPKAQPGERVLDFNATPEEYALVRKIMERVIDTLRDHVSDDAASKFDAQTAAMDLIAVHRNAMPLNFYQLLIGSDDDLTHDVFGVGLHWDRRAGQLLCGWTPRCARKKS